MKITTICGISAMLTILLPALTCNAAEIKLKKQIERPDDYFKTHPKHQIPKDMVIQKFKVKYTPKVTGGKPPYSYKYELLKASPGSRIENSPGKFTSTASNTFVADAYGENVIGITVKDSTNKVIATKKNTVFVHFSRSKVAGGDHTKLDKKYGNKKWIAGVIENDKLVYQGLRFLPSIQDRIDKRYNGGKFGFYETTEPRIFRNPETGTIIASYHAKIKGKNDAPPGQCVIVLRSEDNGHTWTHDQVIDHDINAVVGYTSFAYWKGEIQCYYSGGHFSHKKAIARKGVYRVVSKDDGKTWSKPEQMHEMTKLVSGKENIIGKNQYPICNSLQIPNMEWKGVKGDAILVPFYVAPTKFLITLDGGKTWDMFYDSAKHPDLAKQMDEISWDLLDNRTIYVVSRRKAKKGYKNEFIFDLKGKPEFFGQTRKNHLAKRCHHGSVKIPDGEFKGRVMLVNHYKSDREDATLALSTDPSCKKFSKPRYLTFGAAWGYCDILWNPKLKCLSVIGESEPFDDKEKVIRLTKPKAPTRNERFSIQHFQLSMEFYKTLVEVPKL